VTLFALQAKSVWETGLDKAGGPHAGRSRHCSSAALASTSSTLRQRNSAISAMDLLADQLPEIGQVHLGPWLAGIDGFEPRRGLWTHTQHPRSIGQPSSESESGEGPSSTIRPVRDMSGDCSASDRLQAGQGMPAPPHWQASARSEKKPHGRSRCASHTQPVASQTGHLRLAVMGIQDLARENGSSPGSQEYRRRSGVLGVRAPVRPDFGADAPAFTTGHASAERPHRIVVAQMVGVHLDAVVADDVAAVDQHVATAEVADVAERDRF
jgi:hypothetical protein